MDWSIKSENFRRIYDYFSRKSFNIDERFFHDLTYPFVRIYKDIQEASCTIKYKTDVNFKDYFPTTLNDKCIEILNFVPEDKREELRKMSERNLGLHINGNTSLKKAFGYQKRWIVKAETQAVYGKLEEHCKKIMEKGIVWDRCALVLRTLREGGILVVDEFDASIHLMALMNIITLFHNDELNTHNAQLVFNTHNPIFLNSNLFRRDEIKFVDRDDETHCSTHYSLSDFGTAGAKGVRLSEDYMKNYFVDRYGAIKSIDLAPIIRTLMNDNNKE